jgi:acyl carrier protein
MPAETHVTRGPLGPDEVLRLVRDRLGEILGLDEVAAEAAVVPSASLDDDLGTDDMARIELAEALEAELGERTVGFSIDDEDLAELETVAELVDYVVARLEAPGPDAPAERPGVDVPTGQDG